jgi:hypothetical protein
MTKKIKYPTPEVGDVHPEERALQLVQIINSAMDRFAGSAEELEKSVGMLMVGDYVGWKVLVIWHNKRTIRKYEEILGINIREFFPEEGSIAMRSVGYDIAMKLGSFWKVVSGDVSVENRRDMLDSKGNDKG